MENGELSGNSAAELRREKRRQKILSNSADRMKKIMRGYSEEPPEEAEITNNWTDVSENDTSLGNHIEPLTTDTNDIQFILGDDKLEPGMHEHTEAMPDISDEAAAELLGRRETPEKTVEQRGVDTFTGARTLLVLIVGILIRISFFFSFGQDYVQSIVNPFIAMEIAIIGYQKTVDMDLGANVKGGIWLSTLVLTGIKPDLIATYKTFMGIFSAIAADFMVFFLGFIITHIIV